MRSGWPGPGMCARDARVYLFFCSFLHLPIVPLAAANHNCVGLTQSVRRLSVVSTNMGKVLLYSLFLTGPPPFGGQQVSSSTPVHVVFFRVSVGAIDVRAASGHSQHFLLIRENCGLLFFLACRSLCEVGMAWPGDVRA